MPTNRTPIRHPHRGRLTHSQEMVLLYGPEARWAEAFQSEAEQRDAWIRNRDRLLTYRNAHRPWAWWQFEAGDLRYPGYDREQATLYAAGLLDEEERAELAEFWRGEFEKASAPDFWTTSASPGCILEGEAAKRAHLRWADVPASCRGNGPKTQAPGADHWQACEGGHAAAVVDKPVAG